MHKAGNPKHPGTPGHNKKIKPKDYRYRHEDLYLKGPVNIFNKIVEENFPNLEKKMPMNIQEAFRTPNRLDQNRKSSLAHNNQNTKFTKQRILKAVREKGQVTYKGRLIRITSDFSPETMKARRS